MIATRITALVLALFGSSSTVWAQQSFAMDFDEIPLAVAPPPPPSQDFGIAVVGYYDNDPIYGRDGRMPWDTTFSSNAIAVCSREQSGLDPSCFGGFAAAQSGISSVGAAPEEGSVVSFDFSVASGLVISKLSFYYNVQPGSASSFELFSNGSSVVKFSLSECVSAGGDGFCGWTERMVLDDVLAGNPITKVAFSSNANSAFFDSVAVTTVPIPEPSTYALMLLGLAGIVAASRRRAR